MNVAITEAKARFAELVRRAEAGEDIVSTRHGRAVARIVPAPSAARRSLVGALRGQIRIADDFDDLPSGFVDALSERAAPE
ncbi:MAG: type II toxin-antitoxin system Phd/YefM family antitoxin [Chromatiales bacterium]|nr:type II toxin-antitoxin system Phd/YefM family antitoxin [Chromatiales bacterium]